MSEYCIELNHLTKKFGNFTAVNDLSLKLEPGKVYGVVGPNGAGKSTTMGMIMGSLFPTKGDGKIFGHPLASVEALKMLGYSPEFTSFYSDMSCLEYLWYMGTLSGLSEKQAMEKAHELIEHFELQDSISKKVAKFSTGMKKKVSLAQAMIGDPKILLLDEPTANLDPTSRMEILNIVRKMVDERQLTVLISSHVLTELQTVIDHVVMIDHGHLILNAPIKEAQKMFTQSTLIVKTDNDELLAASLQAYDPELTENGVKVKGEDMASLKKFIVRAVFTNDLQLDSLSEEKMSLDMLYHQVIDGGNENETDSK